MDGEFLGSILQQIEELQSIHEKEIKTLSELQAKRQETQQQRKQATDVVMQLKSTVKATVITSLEKEKEISSCDAELSKLAIQLHNAEQENKRLRDQKQRTSNLIAKRRGMVERIREIERQHEVLQRQSTTITPEFLKREALKIEQQRLLAKVEELKRQDSEWIQITEDLNNFQEAQTQITDYHDRLAKKVQQKEEVINEDVQHAAMLWRYMNQFDEGIQMGREDLRATIIACADASAQVTEVERHLDQLQKL